MNAQYITNRKRLNEEKGTSQFRSIHIAQSIWRAYWRKKIETIPTEIVDINEEFIQDPMTYNIKLGGEGGWDHIKHSFEKYHDIGIKGGNKHKYLLINNNEYRIKAIEKFKNTRKRFLENGIDFTSFLDPLAFKGKHHTEETKKILSEKAKLRTKEKSSQYNTCWIYNLSLKENKKIKNEQLEYWINCGWTKGRKMNFD